MVIVAVLLLLTVVAEKPPPPPEAIMVGDRDRNRLGKITKSKWPNYKANYKISLYRDPVRRNSTRSKGGKPLSRQKLGQYGGCIPATLASLLPL
jgi:hypothetical protein